MKFAFFINPLFWVGLYIVGYVITIVVVNKSGMRIRVETKMPRFLMRIFILLTFMVPPLVLPFTRGPKMTIPTPVALTVGILLLVINFIIKIVAQRHIGVFPALKNKAKLYTTGIYGVVRHPLYMSNGLLALGIAILFKSMYALLFSIPYALLYLLIIHFEEKNLLERYGEEYKEYKRKNPWKMIPKVI
ncbi:isoprenylcysteine carboxylmethyltransferase family protein [candidate division WOR-3 bacterium]|nr:isoprenylcysteine carboxylmethyltransferase family protein [candidate division WOR-3 bacterium]